MKTLKYSVGAKSISWKPCPDSDPVKKQESLVRVFGEVQCQVLLLKKVGNSQVIKLISNCSQPLCVLSSKECVLFNSSEIFLNQPRLQAFIRIYTLYIYRYITYREKIAMYSLERSVYHKPRYSILYHRSLQTSTSIMVALRTGNI